MAEIEVLVESLWELDEDQLAAQIGDRAQAIEASIDPRLLEAGQRLFDRVNPLVYDLMCKPLGNDPQTQKILDEAIGQNYTKAAGMLAPALISALGLAPAIATLLATLIVKKIANYTATGICDTWKQTLPKPAS
jgi:hypothetical protein